MNTSKSRRMTALYITPCSYIEIESCICLVCTYLCTYKSSHNSVPVDIMPKPIRGLCDQKLDRIRYKIWDHNWIG